MKSGRVRAVTGQVYMLSPYEELWEKDLPQVVEELLDRDADDEGKPVQNRPKRDKTRVVSYQIPHSACVQIYDYKEKQPRVVFGPDLILLGPDEQFTVLSLSGSTPKVPKQLNVISLLLGPRFSTDVVVVETADHARLSLKLSYNWHFDIPRDNKQTKRLPLSSLFLILLVTSVRPLLPVLEEVLLEKLLMISTRTLLI
jgi:major vault protein